MSALGLERDGSYGELGGGGASRRSVVGTDVSRGTLAGSGARARVRVANGRLGDHEALNPEGAAHSSLGIIAVVCLVCLALVWFFRPADGSGPVSAQDVPRDSKALAKARAYNRTLVDNSRIALPGMTPGPDFSMDFDGYADHAYRSTLPGGEMGRIEIPKINVNLPIMHGAGDKALEQGAGHEYHSSLPVGGRSTHAIISAHRGAMGRRDFMRLGEMKVGDTFIIDSVGGSLWYRVQSTRETSPDVAVADLVVKPGQDLVTLVTCAPMFINTNRLLVKGKRISPPHGGGAARNGIGPAMFVTILVIWAGFSAIDVTGTGGWTGLAGRNRHRFGRVQAMFRRNRD